MCTIIIEWYWAFSRLKASARGEVRFCLTFNTSPITHRALSRTNINSFPLDRLRLIG